MGAGPSDPKISTFRDRCLDETRTLTRAVLSYERDVEIEVGRSERFELSIAGEERAPTPSEGTAQEEVAVGCTVQARLVTSGDGLSVQPSDWEEQQFVAPERRTWTWVVMASAPGQSDGLLQLRPIIRITSPDGSLTTANLGTEDFPVTFNAERTATDVASSAWKMLVGAAGGVVTLVAAYFAIRKFRGRNGPEATDGERQGAATQPADEDVGPA